MYRREGLGGGAHRQCSYYFCTCIYCFAFSMDDVEALRGADANPAIAVADRIEGLEHQLARLTQMVQTGVKLETVGIEERQSVKDALSSLDGG